MLGSNNSVALHEMGTTMGVLSELIIAPADAGEGIYASDSPSTSWDGFNFSGMENVKFATLLSLLSSNSASAELEQWLDEISPIRGDSAVDRWVFVFTERAVTLMASIASKETTEFGSLVLAWAATDEFEGWASGDVRDLLRGAGDIAQSAELEHMRLFLWVSM